MLFRLFLMLKTLVTGLVRPGLLCISLAALPAYADTAYPKILVYGDSLSAAYGIPKQQGWAALLQKKIHTQNYRYTVINASISGETTSGGSTRINSTLAKTKPEIVILALGSNDGLRGLPIAEMKNNLHQIITACKKQGAKVLIVGMKMPPNYGTQYTGAFYQSFNALSRQHNAPLVPFMLENIATNPERMQKDGLHPNAEGQAILLENIWPKLQLLLKR
ncbi:MAG: arylesterase [Betaproteobacteria bacterium HGW-Betaproteobacteria-22]|nr:MAG: arylesterase [Betaproteobacteria bacterium HGW-Betaproteobacteria-22]